MIVIDLQKMFDTIYHQIDNGHEISRFFKKQNYLPQAVVSGLSLYADDA